MLWRCIPVQAMKVSCIVYGPAPGHYTLVAMASLQYTIYTSIPADHANVSSYDSDDYVRGAQETIHFYSFPK